MRREADFPGEPTTIGELMRTPQTTPTRDEAVPTGWRYSINYGPDGEENFANVYAADGQFVGNLRTHHAIAICNAFAVCEKLASAPAPASGGVEAVAEVVAEELALKIVSLSVNWLREDGTDREHDDYVRANWTKEIAEAKRLILAALSPAATPVSEAGGEVDWLVEHLLSWPCTGDERDGKSEAYINGLMRQAARRIEALAEPASSPAGGDLREVVHSLMEAGKISCWMDVNEHIEAFQTITEALSQSASAGRVGE